VTSTRPSAAWPPLERVALAPRVPVALTSSPHLISGFGGAPTPRRCSCCGVRGDRQGRDRRGVCWADSRRSITVLIDWRQVASASSTGGSGWPFGWPHWRFWRSRALIARPTGSSEAFWDHPACWSPWHGSGHPAEPCAIATNKAVGATATGAGFPAIWSRQERVPGTNPGAARDPVAAAGDRAHVR